jgi:hypothetical protein
MLTEDQARLIANSSITAVGKREDVATLPDETELQAAGVDDAAKFGELVMTIVTDPAVGVLRFEHRIDANVVAGLSLDVSIGDLAKKIEKLSAGKMCSNPSTPHPQECCPYPTTCPVCGAPVR